MVLLLIFIAFPFRSLRISLLEFSNLDSKIRSKILIFLSIFSNEIFIEGKFDPSKLPEKASLAAFAAFFAASSP